MSEQLPDVDKLLLTPEQEARAIAISKEMSRAYLGLYSATRWIVYLQDQLKVVEANWDLIFGERDAENAAQWVADLLWKAADVDRLRSALAGIQSCSTCEARRGAATRALGAPSTTGDGA